MNENINNNNSPQQSQNSLSVILEYTELLKKERCRKAQMEVKKIINEFEDFVDIVNKIHEIDDIYENQKEEFIEKQNIKFTYKSPERSSLLIYFFSIRSDMLNYFRKHSIIIVKLFGFQFQLTYDAASYFKLSYNTVEKVILPYFSRVLETGWKVMEPGKYNLFFYFHQLAKKYSQYIPIDEREIYPLAVFVETILPEFATFYNNKNYLDELKEGIIMLEGGHHNEVVNNIFQFIDRIFNPKTISLVNIIFMVLSAHYRRLISGDNFREIHKGDVIPDDRFLMSKRFEEFVAEYTENIEKEQKELEEKIFLLNNIAEGTPETLNSFIRSHYNGLVGDYKHDFSSWIKTFIKAFTSYSKPIFLNSVTIIQEDRKISFAPFIGIWSIHYTDFEKNINMIDELLEHSKTPVSYNKYMGFYKENKTLSSEKEEKVCFHINNIQNSFYELFVKLNKLLYNNYVLTHSSNKEEVINKLDEKKKPISAINNEKRFIPYDNCIVDEYEKPLLEVLMNIARIMGTFLNSLEYEAIVKLVQDKLKVVDKNNKDVKQMFLLK